MLNMWKYVTFRLTREFGIVLWRVVDGGQCCDRQWVSDPLDTWHIIIFQNVLLLNFPRSKVAADSDPEYPLHTSVSESRNDSIPVYCYTWHVWHIIIFQIVFLLNFPSLPPLLASSQLRRSQHFNEEILQILKCWFVKIKKLFLFI